MLRRFSCLFTLGVLTAVCAADEIVVPEGFTSLVPDQTFAGWHGQGTVNPRIAAGLSAEERQTQWAASREKLQEHWRVENNVLINDGHGEYFTTDHDYGDVELLIDYKTVALADSGIYLRGTPQVQIWDYTEQAKFKLGADKGSGGLWNNSPGSSAKDPLVRADKPFGEWNRFRILQVGERTSIWLNDQLVVDHGRMENYWRKRENDEWKDFAPGKLNVAAPLFATGPIQLQTHGGEISWQNIFAREIGADEANSLLASHDEDGFTSVFNGQDFAGWTGAVENYEVVDGAIRCQAGKGGTLYTEREYTDFVVRLETRIPAGGNNGLAIRYPGEGDPAYAGMCELQVLDNEADKYAKLDPRQYHGSAYGMVPASRGYLRPAGQWNFQEVTVQGSKIKVELNGTLILDTDVAQVTEFHGGRPHAGKDLAKGHFGFAGHGDAVEFRNVRIKELTASPTASATGAN